MNSKRGPKMKYKEPTQNVTLTLPNSAIEGLDTMARTLKLRSKSQLITKIGLGEIGLEDLLGESCAN